MLQGNCAEWIVEALELDTNIPELAGFTPVQFRDCYAGTVGGKTVDVGDGTTINMDSSNGTLISQAGIVSSSEVDVRYVGP